jgi:beta-xylosidase
MRPTQAIGTATVAAIMAITGVTLTFGGRTHAPSDHAVNAAAIGAGAAPRAVSSPTTTPSGPPPTHHDKPEPPERLTPRPPEHDRDVPDPFLLNDGVRWVLYSTQVGLTNVPVATTPDLATWSPPTDALPELPAWAEWGHTWAPGALRRPGGFVLYFTARHRAMGLQCIGASTSRSATGPFTATGPEPLVCQQDLGGSIDPHPFVDIDGTTYLLWKADGNAIGRTSTLFSQRLRQDGLALEGHATALLSNDAAWEAPLVENPALLRVEGRYVLLYSGGWWESNGYATGYATCASPAGPCGKVTTERPLHRSDGEVAGPGGACVITGPAADMWLAHHGWTPGAVGYAAGGARSLHFRSLQWDGTRLNVDGVPAGNP